MESNLFSLSGKTALVTGGGRGIGLAIAKGMAEHGADVAIVARSKEQLEATARQIQADTGRKIRPFPFDLGRIEGIDEFFESVIAETNDIDILVNCAGTTIRGPAEDVDLKTWNQVIEVNLTSAFVLSQAFCRHRKQSGRAGRIIGCVRQQQGRPAHANQNAGRRMGKV